MRVAIDTSPLEKNSPHNIRGSGFYLRHLLDSLRKLENLSLLKFTKKDELPKDIELVHFPYFEPFFLTLPFKRNYKMVVTVHDLTPLIFPKEFPVGIKGMLKWQIQKKMLQSADAIITDSDSSKRDIIRLIGITGEKVHAIPLAAAHHFQKLSLSKKQGEALKQKYALPEKFLLYVGDVTANKNLPRLIRAVNTLGIPLFLAGKALAEKNFDRNNAWNRDRVSAHKLIDISENVRILGFVPDDELVALYNLATVFVMPSLYEGFGLPVLEAMSCGTPVIAGNAGSLPEVAGGAALYVDPYNESDIVQKIHDLYMDTRLQKKLSNAGLKQSDTFSWEKTANLTFRVYESFAPI